MSNNNLTYKNISTTWMDFFEKQVGVFLYFKYMLLLRLYLLFLKQYLECRTFTHNTWHHWYFCILLIFRSGFNNHIPLLCCPCARHALTISFSPLVPTYSMYATHTAADLTRAKTKPPLAFVSIILLSLKFCTTSKLHVLLHGCILF